MEGKHKGIVDRVTGSLSKLQFLTQVSYGLYTVIYLGVLEVITE